jgi:photosystem II stability/assembly factor-like uncharacterized protein
MSMFRWYVVTGIAALVWWAMWNSMRREPGNTHVAKEATGYWLVLASVIGLGYVAWLLCLRGVGDLDDSHVYMTLVSLAALWFALAIMGVINVSQATRERCAGLGAVVMLGVVAHAGFTAWNTRRGPDTIVSAQAEEPSVLPTPPVDEWCIAPGVGYANIQSVMPSSTGVQDKTVVAIDVHGAVFLWDSGTSAWRCINDNIRDILVSGCAVSPMFAADATVYLATHRGLFVSTDKGMTWRKLFGKDDSQHVNAIALGPTTVGYTIFIATRHGLFRSSDRGASWELVGTEIGKRIPRTLAISPAYAEDSTLYVGTSAGVFKSTDAGKSWQPACNYLRRSAVRSLSWVGPAGQDARGFLAVCDGFDFDSRTAYLSLHGDARWHRFGAGFMAFLPTENYVVASLTAFSPAPPEWTLFYGESKGTVCRSVKGKWEKIQLDAMQDYVNTIAVPSDYAQSQIVLIGCTRGLTALDLSRRTWTVRNRGLSGLGVADLTVSSRGGKLSVHAAADLGLFESADPVGNWSRCGDTADDALGLAVCDVGGQIFYGTALGLWKSDDGKRWTKITAGINTRRVQALAASPDYSNDHTLYAGTAEGVFRSTDSGMTWEQVGEGFRESTNILVCTTGRDVDHILLAGTRTGAYKSIDRGKSWQRIGPAGTGLSCQALAVSGSFHQDGVILVALGAGLYKSVNAGRDFSPLQITSKVKHVTSIALSAAYANDHRIWVGMRESGIFESADEGKTWKAMRSAPVRGTVAVIRCVQAPSGMLLLAGVREGGVWQYRFSKEHSQAANATERVFRP